ncbi:Uncharacterised protein [uncultured Clostridium sp.]|nr:Uncharacterised protein [uncultured Clostridium sp.]
MLIERLDKPERKLVLKIIDGKDRIAENLSEDSFISGLGQFTRNYTQTTKRGLLTTNKG